MLISFLVLFNLLSEYLSAFFTGENQVGGWFKFMVLGLQVAFWAVEPFFAAWSSDSNLSVEEVFAHI